MLSFFWRLYMGVDDRTANRAVDETVDLQAALDPTRSECVRPTILDHYHRWMRSMSMLEKFMELDGLIRACLPHMSNPRAITDVLERLDNPNLRQDILTKNADKYLANVPINVLEMNECWVRYPLLADIWDIVQKDLVRSGLLPWAMQYPERMLEGRMLNRLMDEIDFEIGAQPITGLPRPSAIAEELPQLSAAIAPPPMLEQVHDEATPPVRPRSVPIGARPAHQDHASYMAEQLGALHDEVEHMDDWTPDTLPVPPAEIDAAAETVKRALKKVPKRSKR
jgi:hypothetical protein